VPAPWPTTDEELAAAYCAFAVDRVANKDVTEFKQRARWQQAWWREEHRLPRGSHVPPRSNVPTPNGSRVEHDYAKKSGCNFLSDKVRDTVAFRLSHREASETLKEERLWSDLLSSMPMCFNLFGELHGDHGRLSSAVHVLWPDHPGVVEDIRFEWSPGRGDRLYLKNRSAFDAAIHLQLPDGGRGVIGIETKYHEDIRREKAPDPKTRLPRYQEVTEGSGIFPAGWQAKLVGTDLQQFWLDHLLVLSMLQHPEEQWGWGRFVIVYPVGNLSVRDAAQRYGDLLTAKDTFEVRTIEELLDAQVLHEPTTAEAFRERYLW
jgi:hypothetical protein